MGRTLIGGSAVASPSVNTTTSSSTSVTVTSMEPTRTRVQGLPCYAVVGRQGTSAYDPPGIEIVDSFGRRTHKNGYLPDLNSSQYSAYSTSSSSGWGYTGRDYWNGLYMAGNPSSSAWYGASDQSSAGMYTHNSHLTHGLWTIDFDWDLNAPTIYKHNGQHSYNSYTAGIGYGSAAFASSGHWIGPAGTRQEHALMKMAGETTLKLTRDLNGVKNKGPRGMYFTSADDDSVDWFDYTDLASTYGRTKGEAAMTNWYGRRFCYHEELNKLVLVTGYSTYTSESYILEWAGAAGKTLENTSLREWLEAATYHNYGTIQSGFTNMSGNGGYNAAVILCHNGDIVIAWKNSSSNYCYRMTPTDNATTATSMSPSGSTTSYAMDQGQNYQGYTLQFSWDMKWCWFACVYYYYHCGMYCRIWSMDDPSRNFQFQDSDTSYAVNVLPYGKSGFIVANKQNWAGQNSYSSVFSFEDTNSVYDETGAVTYDMRAFNYARQTNYNPASTAWGGYTDNIAHLDNDFKRANGMVRRTNHGTTWGQALDTARSTWQMNPMMKSDMRVPTQDVAICPVSYWPTAFPIDGRSNKVEDLDV